MSDNKQIPRTSVRIDFVVREVCHDGSVPEDELRFVRFGEEVSTSGVPDFFQRVGQAMSLMFRHDFGTQALTLVHGGPNKINLIKVVRELGQYGLKDAKDLVEAPMGTVFLIVDPNDLDYCIKQLNATGAKVEARTARPDEHNGSARFQPPAGPAFSPARFVRRP